MASPVEEVFLRVVHVYLDEEMRGFLDEERTQPLLGPLYQCPRGLYYLDEAQNIRVVLQLPPGAKSDRQTESMCVEGEAACRRDGGASGDPSPPSQPGPQSQETAAFTIDQTRFLIELMREHLESDESGLPHNLQELNTRIKRGKGAKKRLWEDMAGRLSDKFGLVFSPGKVARKWQTLIDGYKNIKDNNNSTGRGVIRFKFYDQMDSLLGTQHDIEFPVVGDNEGGLDVRRPEVLGAEMGQGQPSAGPSKAAGTSGTRRHRGTRGAVKSFIDVIQESEEASQRRHDELLDEMRAQRLSFEGIMREFLNKQ